MPRVLAPAPKPLHVGAFSAVFRGALAPGESNPAGEESVAITFKSGLNGLQLRLPRCAFTETDLTKSGRKAVEERSQSGQSGKEWSKSRQWQKSRESGQSMVKNQSENSQKVVKREGKE